MKIDYMYGEFRMKYIDYSLLDKYGCNVRISVVFGDVGILGLKFRNMNFEKYIYIEIFY